MKDQTFAASFEDFANTLEINRGSLQYRQMKRDFMIGAAIAVRRLMFRPDRTEHAWDEVTAEVEAIIADYGFAD
jgi:hypothetical protein